MQSSVYPPFFAAHGIHLYLPELADQTELHRIIYEELIRGEIMESSQNFVKKLIKDSVLRHKCDGAILGCTELPLLFGEVFGDFAVPDSTRLIAHGAIAMAIGAKLEDVERLITSGSGGEGAAKELANL